MADFNILDVFEFNTSLLPNIIWQYENAENLKSLITQKNTWYQENLNTYWQTVVNDFLNIETATDWGLNLWGKILKVNRIYNVNGELITLSTDLYRTLILGKLQLIHSNGTVPEINKYLNFVFKEYITDSTTLSYVYDNQDMTVRYYLLNFEPSEEMLAVIYARDILPTPAGVDDNLYLLNQTNIFGFYGSGFQPFNCAPFWDGRFIG